MLWEDLKIAHYIVSKHYNHRVLGTVFFSEPCSIVWRYIFNIVIQLVRKTSLKYLGEHWQYT